MRNREDSNWWRQGARAFQAWETGKQQGGGCQRGKYGLTNTPVGLQPELHLTEKQGKRWKVSQSFLYLAAIGSVRTREFKERGEWWAGVFILCFKKSILNAVFFKSRIHDVT